MTDIPHHTKYSPYHGTVGEKSPRAGQQCCLSVAEQYRETLLGGQNYLSTSQNRDPPATAAPVGVGEGRTRSSVGRSGKEARVSLGFK
jgi:hypothetical protein